MNQPPVPAEKAFPELGLPSAATLRRLGRKRVVPVIKVSYRLHLYDIDACRAALAKRTVKAL